MTGDAEVDETTPLLQSNGEDEFCNVAVYPLVHEIRVDIVAHIDTPLTYDQLIAPDSTYTIIRPLTEKYIHLQNPSVVFCLLLNKVQFMSDSHKLSITTLSDSRACLCEILAIRVLRGWSERSLPLATVLLTPWHMFRGAPPEVLNGVKDEGEEEVLENSGTAMEMAIISQSKRFIRSPSCQKVIEGIWSGKIVYSSHSSHALIQDNYKKRPIQIYNPHKAPVLDHYRLKVPKYRSLLEYINFVILFILYVMAIENLDHSHITIREAVFMIYAVAFSVDKLAATREHGIRVFTSSLVNGFDLIFVLIFLTSFFARVIGTVDHNANAMTFGADLLAIGAVLMFPRLVFMTLANNLMILSIRSMLMEFIFLMVVGIVCFLGFLYALYTLGDGSHPISQITWWLLEIYFGLDATGFETSSEIHPFLGPILMVVYAFLSNTLLLTVAVAILGNTFAIINADASAESMFRKAVATIEGVKADSVFSYQLPFNLIALMLLFPLKFVLNARWFHKVNVVMIRVTNLPVLLGIALYERQAYSNMSVWEQVCDYTDHYVGKISAVAGFEGFVGTRMDVSAVFEIEREFGSFYKEWDDDVFGDDEEEDAPEACDEEQQASTTMVEDAANQIMASPEEAEFSIPASGSPVTHRRRRSSFNILSPHHSTGIIPTVPTAPLPGWRARRNSTAYGPSPLAQLFVRSPGAEAKMHGPQRRSTLGVGSLPISSTFHLPGSPRRPRASMDGSTPTAAGPSSLSTSSVASIVERPKIPRPTVTPIQEHPPAIDSPAKTPSPEKANRGGADEATVPFPTDMIPDSSHQHITFQDTPASRRVTPSILEPSEKSMELKPTMSRTSSGGKIVPSSTGKAAPSPRLKPIQTGPVPGMKSSGPKTPMTASELLEAGGQVNEKDATYSQLAAMAKMEERQKRIEGLLEQLLSQVAGDSGVQIRGGVECTPRRAEARDTFDDIE